MASYDEGSTINQSLAYGFALLGRMPGADARAALEAAAVRVALGMNGQDVANLMWGFATVIWQPGRYRWILLATS
jgi:hypothetical protein